VKLFFMQNIRLIENGTYLEQILEGKDSRFFDYVMFVNDGGVLLYMENATLEGRIVSGHGYKLRPPKPGGKIAQLRFSSIRRGQRDGINEQFVVDDIFYGEEGVLSCLKNSDRFKAYGSYFCGEFERHREMERLSEWEREISEQYREPETFEEEFGLE
jgi:hypothetical protein